MIERVPFDKMTAEQHAEAACECDKFVADCERVNAYTSLYYRMQLAAIEHRNAAVQKSAT
ncbi:MAG: hypothetical protein AAGB02_03230 [Pseudomonadota bacterium]